MNFSLLWVLLWGIGGLLPSVCGQETAWEVSDKNGQAISRANTSLSDKNVPMMGVRNTRPLCDAQDGVGCSVGVKILAAFEADELVTVTEVETGELICENLDTADDADSLQFTLASNEMVTARRKSFHEHSGNAFSDGIRRKVWVGEIFEGNDFDSIPRIISMTWSGCDLETFMLKVITPTKGGTFTTVSVPCNLSGDTSELCVLKMHREEEDETDEDLVIDEREYEAGGKNSDGPVRERRLRSRHENEVSRVSHDYRARRTKPGLRGRLARKFLAKEVERGITIAESEDSHIKDKDDDIRLLKEYLSAPPGKREAFHESGVRRLNAEQVSMPSGRVLQATTTVDVMVLYTKKAKFKTDSDEGTVRTSSQMETYIITAYEGANNAFLDSGIDLKIRVVHVQEIDFVEGNEITDAVIGLCKGDQKDLQVHELRDRYGADLVQMIAFYPNTCGIGYTMPALPTSRFAKFGYSVVHVSCLSSFSHIHEIGHNLGANHDRDNSEQSNNYGFAFRYCSGINPYRTVMSYSSGCSQAPRVNVFSTPLKTYAGKPQGTATEDNARVLNEAVSTVSNFRESISDTAQQTTPAPSPKSSLEPTSDSTFAPTVEPTLEPTMKPTLEPAPKPTLKPTSKSIPWPSPEPISKPSSEPMAKPMAPQPLSMNYANAARSSDQAPSVGSIYPSAINKIMTWKGCFKDDIHDRVMSEGTEMPAILGVTTGMTRDNCMAYCYNKKKGYSYFGMENGNECFCSWNTDYRRLGKLGREECDTTCEGNSGTTCGGHQSLEVFGIKKLDKETNVSSPIYQGCYRESMLHLEMANMPVVDYWHTSHEVCDVHCKAAGFAYFGLEFGFMCSCGNAPPSSSLKVPRKECSLPCSSPATTRTCGGNWNMAVFEVGTIN